MIKGSGKTFTMTGGNILSIGENEYGIIPRAVHTVFKTLQVCLISHLRKCT
jgi:hypothetical protein